MRVSTAAGIRRYCPQGAPSAGVERAADHPTRVSHLVEARPSPVPDRRDVMLKRYESAASVFEEENDWRDRQRGWCTGLASYFPTSVSAGGPPARERPSSFSFCTGTAAVTVAVRSGAARRARVPAAGIGTRVPAKAAEAEAMHAAMLRARGGVAAAAAREGRGGAGREGGGCGGVNGRALQSLSKRGGPFSLGILPCWLMTWQPLG